MPGKGYSDLNSVLIGIACTVGAVLVMVTSARLLLDPGIALDPRQRLQVGAAMIVPLASFALAFNLRRLLGAIFRESEMTGEEWQRSAPAQHRLAVFGFILVSNLALYQALEALRAAVGGTR